MKIVIGISLVLLMLGCESPSNPPFIVKEIGSEYFNVPDKCTYMSYEENYVIDDCGKYQIGDTIPNVVNYINY